MKAEVPVSYIIAIIIGIAVIALLGYWFFMTGGGFRNELSSQECISLKSNFCNLWSASGYRCKDLKFIPAGCTDSNPPIVGKWDDYVGTKGGFCSSTYGISVKSSSDCGVLSATTTAR